jgi:hypothetical protein
VKENTVLPFQLNAQTTTIYVVFVFVQLVNHGAQPKKHVLLFHLVVLITTDVETVSQPLQELHSVLSTSNVTISQPIVYNGITVDHAPVQMVTPYAHQLKYVSKNQFAVQDNPTFVETVLRLSLVTTGAPPLKHAAQLIHSVQTMTMVVEFVHVLLEIGVKPKVSV